MPWWKCVTLLFWLSFNDSFKSSCNVFFGSILIALHQMVKPECDVANGLPAVYCLRSMSQLLIIFEKSETFGSLILICSNACIFSRLSRITGCFQTILGVSTRGNRQLKRRLIGPIRKKFAVCLWATSSSRKMKQKKFFNWTPGDTVTNDFWFKMALDINQIRNEKDGENVINRVRWEK